MVFSHQMSDRTLSIAPSLTISKALAFPSARFMKESAMRQGNNAFQSKDIASCLQAKFLDADQSPRCEFNSQISILTGEKRAYTL
jgi:hypothetical protein